MNATSCWNWFVWSNINVQIYVKHIFIFSQTPEVFMRSLCQKVWFYPTTYADFHLCAEIISKVTSDDALSELTRTESSYHWAFPVCASEHAAAARRRSAASLGRSRIPGRGSGAANASWGNRPAEVRVSSWIDDCVDDWRDTREELSDHLKVISGLRWNI